jgi:hypothetical protein
MVTVYRLVMFMELNLLFSDEEIKVSSSLTVKRKVGGLTLGSYSFASFFLMKFYKLYLYSFNATYPDLTSRIILQWNCRISFVYSK